MNFFNAIKLSTETKQLASVFSYLQQKAVTSSTEQELIFDLKNHTYSYNSTKNKYYTHALSKSIEFGFIPNVIGPPGKPKNIIKKVSTFQKKKLGNPVVRFLPDGNANPGTIYLVDKNKKYMQALTCSVELSSCARVYRYINNKWVSV